MDIWVWLREKRGQTKSLLEEADVKESKREVLTNGIEDLMFEAFNLGKEVQKEESNK